MIGRTVSILILALCVAWAGCSKPQPKRNVPHPRIVSFSPALTATLFAMGLGEHVVGVTTYCNLPAGQDRPVVGNVMNIRAEPILAVKPDIVMVQAAEKHFAMLRKVAPETSVEHFTIETLDDIASAMQRIGQLVGKAEMGEKASRDFTARITRLRKANASQPRVRVLFVTGHDNPLATGRETFINEMIELVGGRNVMAEQFAGWKRPSLEAVIKHDPDVIICQSTPSQQGSALKYWRKLPAIKRTPPRRVYVVTDSTWTIPAPHLAEKAEKLAEMLHPAKATGADAK